MLYYLTTIVYVLVCFVADPRHPLAAGQGRRHRQRIRRGRQPGGVRRAQRRHGTVTDDGDLAVLFMIGALVLGIMGQTGPGSVMGGAPRPTRRSADGTPAAPAPAAPARPRQHPRTGASE